MFIYWYKKKMFGIFEVDQSEQFKIRLREMVDLGVFDKLPDNEIKGYEYDGFYTITNDEEFKKKIDNIT